MEIRRVYEGDEERIYRSYATRTVFGVRADVGMPHFLDLTYADNVIGERRNRTVLCKSYMQRMGASPQPTRFGN